MAVQKNERVERSINKLHDSVLSLILSTLNSKGELETSYSPYLFDGSNYYVLTSDLAPHSQNMRNNPNISFLIIEDEANTKYIYDRTRLSYQAKVAMVERESDEFNRVITSLKERTGKILDMLTSMKDFNLYKITPISGRLVLGFGDAYLLDNQTKNIIHVDKDFIAKQKEIAN